MGHPSNGEAWNVLDIFDADFASDARNIHFRLATDGLDPFSTNSTPYSCCYQEEELPPSFIIDPGVGLDDLVRDVDDIEMCVIVKQKWKPIKKKFICLD
jgi:hypothetical protein